MLQYCPDLLVNYHCLLRLYVHNIIDILPQYSMYSCTYDMVDVCRLLVFVHPTKLMIKCECSQVLGARTKSVWIAD